MHDIWQINDLAEIYVAELGLIEDCLAKIRFAERGII